MARTAKKEKALTPEEKLAQALVPDVEQPYRVPENWCWVVLGSITQVIGGGTPSSGNPEYYENGSIAWITPADLSNYNDIYISNGAKSITQIGLDKSSARLLPRGTVCLSSRAPIGYVAIAANPLATNQGFKSFLPSPAYNPLYLYWYLKGNKQLLEDRASGTTFLELSGSKAATVEFPLAPLAEQQRIVDRIESLFAKLDEAKEKAQVVVDGFEDRKAAILHKAFTGELTAEWRKKNRRINEEWQQKEIGDFSFVTKLAGFEYTKNIAPNITENGIPLFKGKNVQQGKLVLEFESYIPKGVSDELPRSKLTKKCLLTPYVGTIGNIAIFDGTFEAHLGSNVGKIEINSDTFEEYLLYYLRSDLGYKELTKEKKATAQESISIQAIRNVLVPIPTTEEQKEIVRLLDFLIGKEEQAKEAAEQVIDQIDTMKKSILARAFRGELGTNDPADESAVELLKRVL